MDYLASSGYHQVIPPFIDNLYPFTLSPRSPFPCLSRTPLTAADRPPLSYPLFPSTPYIQPGKSLELKGRHFKVTQVDRLVLSGE